MKGSATATPSSSHQGDTAAATAGSAGQGKVTQDQAADGLGGSLEANQATGRGASSRRSIRQQQWRTVEPKKELGNGQRACPAAAEGGRGGSIGTGPVSNSELCISGADAEPKKFGRGQRRVQQVALSDVFRQCKPGRGAAVTAAAVAAWDQKGGKAGATDIKKGLGAASPVVCEEERSCQV
jgi:hypothetical protein